MTILVLLACTLLGYAAGSIPFGYLTGRLKGIDIRREGSGNIGATNVGRLFGRGWGILVLALDALKGFLPVWGLATLSQGWLISTSALPWYALLPQRAALVGLATVAGHLWPFTLGFRGGKGVATGLGLAAALTVLFPDAISLPVVLAIVVWAVIALSSRYVSVASMLAAVTFGACYLVTSPNPFNLERVGLTAIALAVPLLVLVRHHTNIARLLRGEESKWGKKRGHST